ncbi:NADPH:quinone oxidoreductase family protein [uncultured Tateyamaria sp.]|uniref:NADPH:quinone oxidoreductase family protein n=1 Tax=uncultured Tateyamaria sp. TaxID=455651 RepID=UPI002611648F|nr:NADPH:quinone oxidoreductase family protein [uncultured Tateyamaria sp.]
MHAMLSTAPGGPETLEWTEGPTPEPKKGEVRIAVKAAGVNFPDTLIIRDLYQMKPPRPFAPGGEVSGIVEAVGEGVTTLAEGDRVLAMTGFGGFTTHLCTAATACVKIPDGMPFDEAACFIFTYGTSHYALKDRGELKSGETLLILGAAGGVGAAAIELGKATGAKVIAAVSSQDKADFCRDLGADETIIYPSDMDRDAQKALSGEIKKAAGPDGVHVAYDAVGGDYAEPVIRSMAWGGRFLVVGFPAGIPAIPLNLTLLKSCQIVGVFWGASIYKDPAGHAQNIKDLFDMYGKGLVKPRISASFSMQDAAQALALIADRKVCGKVVLTNP